MRCDDLLWTGIGHEIDTFVLDIVAARANLHAKLREPKTSVEDAFRMAKEAQKRDGAATRSSC